MAVGTEQLEVLEAIVQTFSVAVVDLRTQWRPLPFIESAPLTAVLFEASLDQPLLEILSVGLGPPDDQEDFDWKFGRS